MHNYMFYREQAYKQYGPEKIMSMPIQLCEMTHPTKTELNRLANKELLKLERQIKRGTYNG